MRIAQLIDSLSLGGAEKLQITFAEAALARGFTPTVISLARAPGSPVPETLRKLGVPMVEFPGRNLVDPLRFVRLTRYLLREKFDVIHAHLEYSIILGSCAGFIAGVPVVATVHNIYPDRWKKLEPFMLQLGVKHVIAVGEMVANAYKEKLKDKPLEVVANPVKPAISISDDERKLIRIEIAIDASRPLLIAVGRLEVQKGFSNLIQAMQVVHETHPRAFLAIVGGGSLREQLQNQIDSNGAHEFIKLVGIRNDVPLLLSASDIFVSTSLWEGMPVAVLEAMSAGLAIVATGVGDVPRLLEDDRGVLVFPGQLSAASEALTSLLNDSERREMLGARARAFVLKNHNANVWLDKLLKIYQSVS